VRLGVVVMGSNFSWGRKTLPSPELWHRASTSSTSDDENGDEQVSSALYSLSKLHEWVDERLLERQHHSQRYNETALAKENKNIDGPVDKNPMEGKSWERCFEVKATNDESRAGLFCRAEHLSPGNPYLRLPHELVMDVEKALRSPLIGSALCQLESEFGQRDEPTMLVLFLLSERSLGATSFFAPFIATLPRNQDFYHMPFYWNEDDLAELQGHVIFDDIIDQRRAVADGWRNIEETVVQRFGKPSLGSSDPFPRSVYNPVAFRWAYHIWQTRCIRIHVNDYIAAAAEGASTDNPPEELEISTGRDDRNGSKCGHTVQEGGTSFERNNTAQQNGIDDDHGDSGVHRLPVCGLPYGVPIPSTSHWAFIPFIDMTNCRFMRSQRASHTGYDRSQHSVVMRATEHYYQGDQLYENYGWSNHAYLLSHGFFLEPPTTSDASSVEEEGQSCEGCEEGHGNDSLHLPRLDLPVRDASRAFLLNVLLNEGRSQSEEINEASRSDSSLPPHFYPLVGHPDFVSHPKHGLDPTTLCVVYLAKATDEQQVEQIMASLASNESRSRVEAAWHAMVEDPSPALLSLAFEVLANLVEETAQMWRHGQDGLEHGIGTDLRVLRDHCQATSNENPLRLAQQKSARSAPKEHEGGLEPRKLRKFQEYAVRFRLDQRRCAKRLVKQYRSQSLRLIKEARKPRG
jgi:hypothetical protein